MADSGSPNPYNCHHQSILQPAHAWVACRLGPNAWIGLGDPGRPYRPPPFQGGPYASLPSVNPSAPPSGAYAPIPSPGLARPPANTAPKAPKHPAADREHISESDRSIFEISNEYLGRLKQNMPPQKRTEVIECRLNVLFDVLNCETILRVIEKLLTLSRGTFQVITATGCGLVRF
ncbi:hypothetical protein V565_163210 [Rhizoctonia solani 123E]|uniref:Uncharacterized protein n=1 Tax=Rhizoctonia solani 123E TaxID=1423351 RepID=A0A074RRG8_9AGAM|nr:hypothetical protein V565_163210 [Rhizoctonia solani 123E]